MEDIEPLQFVPVVETTGLTCGGIVTRGRDSDDQLLLAFGETISIRHIHRPAQFGVSARLPGAITSAVILDGASILVSYRKRGVDYFNVLSEENDWKEKMLSPPPVPLGMGATTPVVRASNSCDGVVVQQIYEGSLHIFLGLGTAAPSCQVSHINRISPILPVLSMALIRRSENLYALIAIFGDNEAETELRTFEIKIKDGKATLTHVTSILGGLARVRSEVKPYHLALNQSNSSILFIGGDSLKYSSIMCMSISELFSRESSRECMHCQPMPRALAVAGSSENHFFIATAFGELYSLDTNSMNVTLLDDRIPGSVTGACVLSYSSNILFIGSKHGDSMVRFSSGEKRIVHQNISPSMALAKSTNFRTITTVSGAGNSASLNRVKTSGIGVVILGSENSFHEFKPENIFCVNDVLIMTWPHLSLAFSISPSFILDELADLKFPANIIGVFQYDTGMFISITAQAVVVVSSKGVTKQTWQAPAGSSVTACDYCEHSRALALLTSAGLFRITPTGTHTVERKNSEEGTCVAIHNSVIAVGYWNNSVEIFENDQLVMACHELAADPRSLIVLTENDAVVVIAGLADGSVVRAATQNKISGWRKPESFSAVKVGTLPPTLRRMNDGKSVMVLGDRPCVMTASLECTELVDRASGTLLFVRQIAGITHGGEFLWFLDSLGALKCCRLGSGSECHFQRRLLDETGTLIPIFPVAVESFEESGQILVAVSSIDPDSKLKDYIGIYDIFQLTLSAKIEMHERITGLAKLGPQTLIVALSDGNAVALEQEAKTGLWTETTKGFVTPQPITGIASSGFGKYFVCLSARTLSVLQYCDCHIEHCASIETSFLGLCVSFFQEKDSDSISIAVGDIHRSVALYAFDPMEGLVMRARDLVPCCAMAVELVSSDSLIMGDDQGNVYFMKMVEPALARLERLQGCNIGEVPVSAIRRVNSIKTACWVCSSDGSISLIGSDLGVDFRAKNIPKFVQPVFEPHRLANPSVAESFRDL